MKPITDGRPLTGVEVEAYRVHYTAQTDRARALTEFLKYFFPCFGETCRSGDDVGDPVDGLVPLGLIDDRNEAISAAFAAVRSIAQNH